MKIAQRRVMFGCEIVAPVHQGRRSSLFRVRRTNGELAVVKLASPAATFGRREELTRELRFLEHLAACDAVPNAYGLLWENGATGLLLQNLQETSLKSYSAARPFSVEQALTLGLTLTQLLQQIHAAGVIHRDFGAHNILFNPQTGSVKVCDFASASYLAPDEDLPPTPLELGDGMAYLAPEQTGRFNRRVDRRSDYYSLGVTLYELLTGSLPFDATDPLTLIHSHVARVPETAAALDPKVPPAVSLLLERLLAKDPDERYQSGEALERDLQICLTATQLGTTHSLVLEGHREHRRLVHPSRLVGRETELETLRLEYRRALEGCARPCLVIGPSGIGKSALVERLADTVRLQGGLFCAGKFEQYDVGTPYAAITGATQMLAEQLLTLAEQELKAICHALKTSAPSVGSVLTAFCPRLTGILGEFPPPPRLLGIAGRVRLESSLITLLTAASQERALCLHFDDLQWADADSLEVIATLTMGCRRGRILFTLASRGEEATLPAALLAWRKRLDSVVELNLTPLSPRDVQDLLLEMGMDGHDVTTELADITTRRTGGNPFFVRAFLSKLLQDGLLPFERHNSAEKLAAIRQAPCTDNLVDLLVTRIASLPLPTRRLLQVAACVGRHFDVRVVAHAAGTGAADLKAACEAELITLVDSLEHGSPARADHYRFLHDRVHQAVMGTLGDHQRREIHARIAETLRGTEFQHDGSRFLFETVTHMNHAATLVEHPNERLELARLNLEAARSAMAGAANTDALRFACAGTRTLGEHAWARHPELARELRLATTEAALACAEYEKLEEAADEIRTHSSGDLDVARMRCLTGRVRQAQSCMTEAIAQYTLALSELGIDLPSVVSDEYVAAELRQTAALLAATSLERIPQLSHCESSRSRLTLELLNRLLFSTFSMVSDLFPVVTCRLVRLSIELGIAPESANGFTFYGLLLARNGDISGAYGLGEVALRLARHFDEPASLSQAYLYAHYQLMHWRTPLAELAGAFGKAYELGLSAGSPLNAACSATTLCICRFWAGENLETLSSALEPHQREIATFRQNLVLNWHEILMQSVDNLRRVSAEPTQFSGPFYDERERLDVHLAAGDKSALFNLYLNKAFLCCVFGQNAQALTFVHAYEPFLSLFGSGYFAVPALFIATLSRLANCATLEPQRANLLVEQARDNLRTMKRWQPFNPQSLDHKLLTVEAELARIDGDYGLARQLFAEAAQRAKNAGIAHEEAITCELAGRFHLLRGDEMEAREYIRSSRRAYVRWGALAKVFALEAEYPQLLPTLPQEASSLELAEEIFDPLDFVSIQIASRAISKEIRLDRLLLTLMTVLIENSGAREGYLLLPKNDSWVVEIGRAVDGRLLSTMQSMPMSAFPREECAGPVEAVVNFVGRTAEAVLINDAYGRSRFGSDARLQSGAVLCFPLQSQGKVTAISYLTHPMSPHTFTASRLRVLEFLSTQAAISLENARLYEDLEERVRLRTQELQAKNNELDRALQRVTEMQQQLVLREKLAELGALTAGIAHQLKNPLNFVVNLSEISCSLTDDLQEALSDAGLAGKSVAPLLTDIKATANKVAEHGRRASAVVSGMALHARSGSSNWQSVGLTPLIEQSLELGCKSKGSVESPIEITRDYDPQIENVFVVPGDLVQVFVNLVENACYSLVRRTAVASHGYRANLSVKTRAFASNVEIRFRDNGLGIPHSEQDRVFVPFFTTKPPGSGTGLGLSISNDIVCRVHRGSLLVDSEPGQFAEFIVVIPKDARH